VSLLSLAGLHDQLAKTNQAVRRPREALAILPTPTIQGISAKPDRDARAQRDSAHYDGALPIFAACSTRGKRARIIFRYVAYESIGAVLLKKRIIRKLLRNIVESGVRSARAEGLRQLGCANALAFGTLPGSDRNVSRGGRHCREVYPAARAGVERARLDVATRVVNRGRSSGESAAVARMPDGPPDCRPNSAGYRACDLARRNKLEG